VCHARPHIPPGSAGDVPLAERHRERPADHKPEQQVSQEKAWVLLASAALVAVFAPATAYLYNRQR